ncbi:hypothetical protein BGX38DRAFT_1203720 [Terfezia claveryi]|nr:hypothetical protein BGX38DRAFT_1203720 [Terfezia claveryi]
MINRQVDSMDFYKAGSMSSFLINISNWWWLPDRSGGSTLVISVKTSDAQLWVVTYTILVGLIFTAACDLATGLVLILFRLGQSGTRHAMLVSYYNGKGPSGTILPMMGYIRHALWDCKSKRKWSVDWNALRASFYLLLLAFILLFGDIVTKFFLGGRALVVANAAQANPYAVFYPMFDTGNQTLLDNSIPDSIVDAFKGLTPQAIYQASARVTNAGARLWDRIQLNEVEIANGTLLPDGSTQIGTGAQFYYQYSLTGYEMGLRDAPGLDFTVRGTCATYHKPDGIKAEQFDNPASPTLPKTFEEVDTYPFYGDIQWSNRVYLSRENYTAPWAYFVNKFDNETLTQNVQYGGYTFMIVPHTSWRQSEKPNPLPDPWYDTEESPAFVPGKGFNTKYRVKRGRPALRCTQNDTYTYNGHKVYHVDNLSELPGLKLSPFISDAVFGREFGSPVFSKILGNLPFGTLASIPYFAPNQRRLDATRVSLKEDFRGLVGMSFVYSREVVRNTVLLYSTLKGRNDSGFSNAANEYDGPATNADFFLEGTEVAALSVFVIIITPCFCALLWLLVAWKWFILPRTTIDNKSITARYILRDYGLRAVNLFRNLDEEISRKRKFSGRQTESPYIRDLDSKENDVGFNILPASVAAPQSPAAALVEASPTLTKMATSEAVATPPMETSRYAKPKIMLAEGSLEVEDISWLKKFWNWIYDSKREPAMAQPFEVVMTRAWNPEIRLVKLKNARRDIQPPE